MFDFLKGKNWVGRCDVLRCDDICISRISLHALILIPSLHSFWSLVYIPFANFRSKQMFDFLKGKNWVVDCDALRCDDICISRISLHALILITSLHSFWLLVYIPFATFQSKQMFDFLKGKNWVVHCDVLRCDDICISRISLPARLFFSSLHSFWSLVDISGMLRSMIIARLGPSRSTIFNPQGIQSRSDSLHE